jgi:putative hydrolase of the HAD superfamily
MAEPWIRVVTFDVGGTLIEPWPSVGHIYAEVAALHGVVGLSASALSSRFGVAWATNGCRAESRADWQAVVRDTFQAWPALADNETFFASLYDRFTHLNAWHIFEDVVSGLESLKTSGIRLGIVSNWDDRLRPLLERLQLGHWFEMMVISCETDCRKPDPAIFRRAAAAFGLPPGRIMHVGDSWEHDVLGARRAGFRAVQVQRDGAADDTDHCTTLSRLVARLSID